MTLIDTHAHIYVEEFDEDLDRVMDRAGQAGISRVVLPAIDSSTHERMLAAEKKYSGCRAMMGVHPCSIKQNYQEELAIARQYLEKRKFTAIGEIGLDFYWDISFKEQQYTAFRQQIGWALEYGLPIAIHSRNATAECIEVVRQEQQGKLQGVFHCFSGTTEQALAVTNMGFYLGIGGVLTFKNAGLDKVLAAIDLSHIVLETDAPYLAPVPYRGKRNEPAYLPYVLEKLAVIKGLTPAEIAAITTANAEKLFGL